MGQMLERTWTIWCQSKAHMRLPISP